jgi:hypothetical protein
MRSSASCESPKGPHGCIKVTIPGDSGILATEMRGPCDRHLDVRHVEIDIP